MPKIAIIGAGLSGLGVAYHLLCKKYRVTLFDPKGIGGGTSGIASGLLHSYPGENARLSWQGKEALSETFSLLKLASDALGLKIAKSEGILRLALSKKQEQAFQKRAEIETDVEWWDAKMCREEVKGAHFCPGIFIHSGKTVHTKLYLKGLWKVCKQLGAHLEKKKVSVDSLYEFDQIVIAAGNGICDIKECKELDVKYNKGQLLVCKKPTYFKPRVSVIGKGYLALSDKEDQCYMGSTYEHEILTEQPCMGLAVEEIFARIGQFLPGYGSFQILDCLSGIRVSNQNSYLPLVGRLKKNLWVLTAMGSRGLLYHGLMGKKLAEAMISNHEKIIPHQVRI